MPIYKLYHSYSITAASCGRCSSPFASNHTIEGRDKSDPSDAYFTVKLTCMRCGHSGSLLDRSLIQASRGALGNYGAYRYENEFPDPDVEEDDG